MPAIHVTARLRKYECCCMSILRVTCPTSEQAHLFEQLAEGAQVLWSRFAVAVVAATAETVPLLQRTIAKVEEA